jgi:hypothetical protein
LLHDDCSSSDAFAVADVSNLQLQQIAGSQLAIDSKIKERQFWARGPFPPEARGSAAGWAPMNWPTTEMSPISPEAPDPMPGRRWFAIGVSRLRWRIGLL